MVSVNGTKLNKDIKLLAKLEGNNIDYALFFLNTALFSTPKSFPRDVT